MHAVCEVCQGAPAVLFCAADEAVLCGDCDEKIHSCNKLASRHVRVRLTESSPVGRCDLCESSPAFFYCCVDGSSLCLDCDIRVHVGAKQSHERYLILRQKVEYIGTKPAPSFQDPPLKQFECEKEIQNGMWWFQQMTDQTDNYEVPQIIMEDDVKDIYVDLEGPRGDAQVARSSQVMPMK